MDTVTLRVKLIFCPQCEDVRKLHVGVAVECRCRKSWGRYVDERYAQVGGQAMAVGFNNSSLLMALRSRNQFRSTSFEAFVIQTECSTVEIVP